MEARRLKTVTDLIACPDARVELIDGAIVRRPMARGEHGMAQGNTREVLGPLQHRDGPGGWWIATEINVAYEAHQCPCHDLAGWRKERMPRRPRGVVELTPDWVCEIVSPGHERKDTLTLLLLLQRHRVPFYWLIWPEDRSLIAYQLEDGRYHIVAALSGATQTCIPPFDGIALDLGYILGDDDGDQ
jgi:Uma2 family endonuclease